MNYSKNIRKAAVTKRVIASWVVVAIVSTTVGSVSGYALKTHITAKSELKEETQKSEQVEEKTLVFGVYDNRCITEEVPLDWDGADSGFKPLDVDMNEEEQKFVYCLSAAYNLDFTLVMALMQYESSFQADVISSTNDYGLMQINVINHEHLMETIGVTDFLDPYQNIRAGTFILRKLFERYQDTNMVLMAYNLGEDGAKRLWENGIYSTEYTEKILNYQMQFNKQLGSE